MRMMRLLSMLPTDVRPGGSWPLARARITFEEAVARLPSVARLRVVGAEILRRAGEPARAAEILAELVTRAETATWGYRRPEVYGAYLDR